MIVLSIDVGWTNLAFIKAHVDPERWVITHILATFCVDLSSLPHKKVPLSQCLLHHSNDAFDKIQHLIQEFEADYFQDLDQIFIERQPITGLVHIEQLLFGYFRQRAQLISPNAMHKFFKIHDFDYETRKKITTKIAEEFLKNFSSWQERTRLHDMGDAFCLLIYAIHEKHRIYQQQQKTESMDDSLSRFNQTGLSVTEFFHTFQHDPPP